MKVDIALNLINRRKSLENFLHQIKPEFREYHRDGHCHEKKKKKRMETFLLSRSTYLLLNIPYLSLILWKYLFAVIFFFSGFTLNFLGMTLNCI